MLRVQNNDDTGLTNIRTSNHFRFGNTLGEQGIREEQVKYLKSRIHLMRENKGYNIYIAWPKDKERNIITTYSFLKDSSGKENYLTWYKGIKL